MLIAITDMFTRWTGADSNPGNNAGQGRARTDRNNIVPLREITWPKEGAFEDEGTYYYII